MERAGILHGYTVEIDHEASAGGDGFIRMKLWRKPVPTACSILCRPSKRSAMPHLTGGDDFRQGTHETMADLGALIEPVAYGIRHQPVLSSP